MLSKCIHNLYSCTTYVTRCITNTISCRFLSLEIFFYYKILTFFFPMSNGLHFLDQDPIYQTVLSSKKVLEYGGKKRKKIQFYDIYFLKKSHSNSRSVAWNVRTRRRPDEGIAIHSWGISRRSSDLAFRCNGPIRCWRISSPRR